MNPDGLGYFLERLATTAKQTGRLPNTETVAALPREERKSAKHIAQHLKEQFERGLDLRQTHAIRWTQVSSILNGIHYFQIDTWGRWKARAGRSLSAQVIKSCHTGPAPVIPDTWYMGALSALPAQTAVTRSGV